MWVLRELVRVALSVVLGTAVALALAAILAAASVQSGFADDARIACFLVGCVVLAMAGVGRGSNLERYADTNVTRVVWGSLPGIGVLKPRPEDRSLTPGAVFVGVAAVLFVLGALF